jgi:tetratricopeptide (TPR) repeat protein
MIRYFLLSLFCLLSGTTCVSATVFDDANAKFKSGDYAGAAASYEESLVKSGPDAAVYYNLGNSYQNLKQYGPAILAYERARLLAPRDPDLLANLALARKAATAFDGSETSPKWQAALGYLSRNEWSYLVVGSALFIGVFVLLNGLVRLGPQVIKWARIPGGLALLAILVGSAALYLRRTEAERGIILAENAAIRLSPFDKAESLGTPGSGKIVHLGVKNGGFQYVGVPGASLRGWMAEGDVGLIEKD